MLAFIEKWVLLTEGNYISLTHTINNIHKVMSDYLEIRIPIDEFRPQPVPVGGKGNITISNCFVPVDSLPIELQHWLEVNPIIPKFTSKNKLTGAVAKGIIKTLKEEPEKFVLKIKVSILVWHLPHPGLQHGGLFG